MTPYLQDADVTLYHGDVLDVLREMPDESVDCAATSPPFYGLRDYGTGRWEGGDEGCDHAVRVDPKVESSTLGGGKDTTGHQREGFKDECPRCGVRRIDQQIGLESTPEEWRDRLVEVFREQRRVLVPTGTVWVECGDSYGSGTNASRNPTATAQHGNWENPEISVRTSGGVKPKDLIGSPFLLAFGLRDDGWYWRSTNIWHKPNCLPESVTDRPVVSHSYVFQFSKKARYFHDAEGVREPLMQSTLERGYTAAYTQNGKEAGAPEEARAKANWRTPENFHIPSGRSLRSVWTLPTEGFPEAHFATWPTKLAERILLMACPEQVCRVCGKARERELAVTQELLTGSKSSAHKPNDHNWSDVQDRTRKHVETLGFTDCDCRAPCPTHDFPGGFCIPPCPDQDPALKYRPGIVLDPFAGSGTTMHVARKLGRHSVGIDLSAEYLALAARRLQQQSLFA